MKRTQTTFQPRLIIAAKVAAGHTTRVAGLWCTAVASCFISEASVIITSLLRYGACVGGESRVWRAPRKTIPGNMELQ